MRIDLQPIPTVVFFSVMVSWLIFALSRPAGLVVALVLFGVGTFVRVRSEEKPLREAFGAQFEVYARHVPAVFPRFY